MKKELTPKEIYKKRQKLAKTFKILAPVIYWSFLALGVMCIFFAIRHSFGNVAEIMDLLDSKKFTGEQLQTNYNYLIGKYGEWVIGNGNNGFTLVFINIGRALFSGLMITNVILAIVLIVLSVLLGKWLLPMLSRQITQDNQDMVNLTILEDKENK